jgi:hypothetical protein
MVGAVMEKFEPKPNWVVCATAAAGMADAMSATERSADCAALRSTSVRLRDTSFFVMVDKN